jgi:CheY-like chemotaxis protein
MLSPETSLSRLQTGAGDAVPRRVLWIDDEISSTDPLVFFLERHGIQVRCAVTGAAGLLLARRGEYQGIVLDLRLPDVPGLSVLARLRADGIDTPVLVLTGFGDVESALVAGRLGASGFKRKPLFIDDFLVVVERFLDGVAPEASTPSDDGSDALGYPAVSTGFGALADLLDCLHGLSHERPMQEGRGRSDRAQADLNAGTGDAVGRKLVWGLIRALADPGLPMPAFLTCAQALRRAVTADAADSPWMLAALAQDSVLQILATPAPADPRVVTTMSMLECSGVKRLTLEEIADVTNIDPAHLGRLIEAETGFNVWSWRTGTLLRASVRHVIETDEQVKHIAYRVAGYKHESQFDRDFREMFGLAPTELRRFWRTNGG